MRFRNTRFNFNTGHHLSGILGSSFLNTPFDFQVKFIIEKLYDAHAVQTKLEEQTKLKERLTALRSNHPELWHNFIHALSHRLREFYPRHFSLTEILDVVLHPDFVEKTKGLTNGMGTTWSIAIACVENMANLNLDFTTENIGKVLDLSLSNLEDVLDYEVYGSQTQEVLIAVHEDKQFDLNRHVNMAKSCNIPSSRIKTFKEAMDVFLKKDLLRALFENNGKTVFAFNGHGFNDSISLGNKSGDEKITYTELAEALFERAKNGANLKKDMFMIFDCCYSFDFALNFINQLNKLLKENNLPLNLPIIFTLSNIDMVSYDSEYYPSAPFGNTLTVKHLFEAQDKEGVFIAGDPSLIFPIDEKGVNRLLKLNNDELAQDGSRLQFQISLPDGVMIGFIHSKPEGLSQEELLEIAQDIEDNHNGLTLEQKEQTRSILEYLRTKVETADIKPDMR